MTINFRPYVDFGIRMAAVSFAVQWVKTQSIGEIFMNATPDVITYLPEAYALHQHYEISHEDFAEELLQLMNKITLYCLNHRESPFCSYQLSYENREQLSKLAVCIGSHRFSCLITPFIKYSKFSALLAPFAASVLANTIQQKVVSPVDVNGIALSLGGNVPLAKAVAAAL
ncbi:hypothetical protein N9Y92_02520 [Chlamydiales bacterium]|nr:hypothetical protein [Chlamydiales bacterium]